MAEIEHVPTTLPDAHDRIETSDVTPLGTMTIDTVRGPIRCEEAPGICTMLMLHADGEKVMTIVLYEPGDPVGRGVIHQMRPESARHIAASLLRMANDVDGGKVSG